MQITHYLVHIYGCFGNVTFINNIVKLKLNFTRKCGSQFDRVVGKMAMSKYCVIESTVGTKNISNSASSSSNSEGPQFSNCLSSIMHLNHLNKYKPDQIYLLSGLAFSVMVLPYDH